MKTKPPVSTLMKLDSVSSHQSRKYNLTSQSAVIPQRQVEGADIHHQLAVRLMLTLTSFSVTVSLYLNIAAAARPPGTAVRPLS